jgi:hypothetical protein
MEVTMRKTALALATVGLISAFTVAAPVQADAHEWHRYGGSGWHQHHNSGAAIGLGILGGILAGAAIASSHHYAPYGTPYGYAGYGYYR